jgi:hypothetical protein
MIEKVRTDNSANNRSRGPALSSGAAPANNAGSAAPPSAPKRADVGPLTRGPFDKHKKRKQ